MKTVNELIKDINSLTSHLHEKDFLLTWEQTPDELKQVLDVAAALKALRAENISTKVFNSGLGISVFRDNLNRPGFPGECFICELRLPDHRFRWKHNKLFLLLP
ncbi:hypothetical protein ABQ335_20395, partial [Shigella boydii]